MANVSDTWAIVSSIATVAAAIFAALAAGASFHAISIQKRNVAQQRIADQMNAYLQRFVEIQRRYVKAYADSTYQHMNEEAKAEIQIVAASLAMLVDSMYRANDPRADIWGRFLSEIPGPVRYHDGFDILIYITDPRARAAVKRARARIGLATIRAKPNWLQRAVTKIISRSSRC